MPVSVYVLSAHKCSQGPPLSLRTLVAMSAAASSGNWEPWADVAARLPGCASPTVSEDEGLKDPEAWAKWVNDAELSIRRFADNKDWIRCCCCKTWTDETHIGGKQHSKQKPWWRNDGGLKGMVKKSVDAVTGAVGSCAANEASAMDELALVMNSDPSGKALPLMQAELKLLGKKEATLRRPHHQSVVATVVPAVPAVPMVPMVRDIGTGGVPPPPPYPKPDGTGGLPAPPPSTPKPVEGVLLDDVELFSGAAGSKEGPVASGIQQVKSSMNKLEEDSNEMKGTIKDLKDENRELRGRIETMQFLVQNLQDRMVKQEEVPLGSVPTAVAVPVDQDVRQAQI